MSRRGENIYKRKDGRWEGRYLKERGSSGKVHFGYVYGKTYHEVKDKLMSAKKEYTDKPSIVNREMSFLCLQWLEITKWKVKESTYAKYHGIVYKHIIPFFGTKSVTAIGYNDIEAFKIYLLGETLSAKTVRDILTVLKSILKHCRKSGISIAEFDITYPHEYKKEMRVLDIDEQNSLISALTADTNTVKFGIILSLMTGMRIGEICALCWGDISIEERTIKISRTMQRVQCFDENIPQKTKIVIGNTKSNSSMRTIPLTDQCVKLCSKFYRDDANAYILTGSSDSFIEPRKLQLYFKRIASDCGLENVHFHTLRHTFATRCVEVGFELKSLSEILGHSGTDITLDRYVHSSMEFKRTNMQKLSSIGF